MEVDHKPGEFETAMDSLRIGPKFAHDHFLVLQKAYRGQRIKITEVTTTITTRQISEGDLAELAKQ